MAYYVRLMENELMRLTYLCTSVLNGSTLAPWPTGTPF